MSDLKEVINLRDKFFEEQEKLYLAMVNQINSQMKELLKNDLGNQLANNCARDFAGEIVRNYLPVNTGEMYITTDQMFDRIINFRYDNDIDPLSSNEEIRKMLYNNENSEIFNQIAEESQKAQKQLFTEDRSQDKLDREGKLKYRESKKDENGILTDELTGQKGEFLEYEKNGQKYQKSDMHADHIQSREAARYNSEYITEKGVEKLKEFINSDDNFQIIHASANTSKGDVRAYLGKDGKVYCDKDKGVDITYKATPEQMAEVTCQMWEKIDEGRKGQSEKKIKTLKKAGYLDKNCKVKKEAKEKLEKQYEKSMNEESRVILKNIKYHSVGKTAMKSTAASFPKIFAGQIMYYGIPPIVYETKCIIKNRNVDLDNFFIKLQKAFKRIIEYMQSKLSNMFSNIAHNSLKSFLRSFFYIIIDLLKATVKKIFIMIKEVVMSFVNSIKILGDKNRTAAEKADAIVNTLGITISSIAVNVIIEYLEVQFPFLKPFTDPLQVIITILTTNIVMLILQKMDIFNVRYGLMVAKIKEIFEEGRAEYREQLQQLEDETYKNIDKILEQTEFEIFNVITDIYSADINEKDLKDEIDIINKTFNMGIDLEKEWNQFAYN
ncbi:hypothetical protein EPJ79_10505 [Brachyspira aalborgi]|uniref:Uncharacterized protein n=1 Tax=Brachyspira aalborgi TaxID=29522 RepID=A0A5C8D7X0_9SPIR|nr:hypothetical protein [Brachyspira aalborgi]TXJ21525.1 hypothetical protein EPJ79_10505 [Brachyspira aalborgi]